MSIKIVVEEMVPSQYEKVVDADLDSFNEFFQKKLGNDPMLKSEKAMIKTYLAWKLGLGNK